MQPNSDKNKIKSWNGIEREEKNKHGHQAHNGPCSSVLWGRSQGEAMVVDVLTLLLPSIKDKEHETVRLKININGKVQEDII